MLGLTLAMDGAYCGRSRLGQLQGFHSRACFWLPSDVWMHVWCCWISIAGKSAEVNFHGISCSPCSGFYLVLERMSVQHIAVVDTERLRC